MTQPIKLKYGKYINEMCCVACDYAGEYKIMGPRLPPMPISICPDCGGALKKEVGRWMYTVIESPWWAIFGEDETTYHGFQKKKNENNEKNPPRAP